MPRDDCGAMIYINRFDDLECVLEAAENHGRGWQALEARVQ